MGNYYSKFIEPKGIVRDINFFYNKIHDLIVNKYFVDFLLNVRKKSNEREFTISNYLSSFNNTRLRFENDTLIIRFSIDECKKNSIQDRSYTDISKPKYIQDSIEGLNIIIDIKLSTIEFKNKTIYPENKALIKLRKDLHTINDFYTNKLQTSMERRFPKINESIHSIKYSQYWQWNNLLNLLKDCTDPDFQENLEKIKLVINGIDSDSILTKQMIVQHTEFYHKYMSTRQINAKKFITTINKVCWDTEEIIYLANQIAKCFGYSVKTIEETNEFILNVLNHFNKNCHAKLWKINLLYKDTI